MLYLLDICLFIIYSIIYIICPKSYEIAVVALGVIPL